MKVFSRGLLIAVLVGLAFLGLGGYLTVQEMLYLNRAVQVTGTVTDLSISTSYQDQQYWTDYCPVVDFRTQDGRQVEFTSDVCQDPPEYKVGQKVSLYYDTRDPKNVQFNNFIEKYSAPVSAAVAGAVVLLIALIIFWVRLLRKNRPAPANAGR